MIEPILRYLIYWPLKAPLDAYRFGASYNILIGILAIFIGFPGIPLRFVAGPPIATWKYATSGGSLG